MNSIRDRWPALYKSYQRWVSQNPQVVGDVETTVKWVSYFIAGRLNTSPIISELIYSLSNLLVLFNDRIIENSKVTNFYEDRSKTQLKILLTTLEYCEVFIEITAQQFWGESGRWFFIFCVQITKCIGRMILTFMYRESIAKSPAITQLNRRNLSRTDEALDAEMASTFPGLSSNTYTLKRSGKIVRKVEGAPPIHMRNWKSLASEQFGKLNVSNLDAGSRVSLAEAIYILKPMVHLGGIAKFGLDSWKSYGLAMLMDAASLRLYFKNRPNLTKEQKVELSKRCVSLLLYLMRSPFYDRFTKNKISGLLTIIANNVPFASAICNPVLDYIPHWQSNYFYMWST